MTRNFSYMYAVPFRIENINILKFLYMKSFCGMKINISALQKYIRLDLSEFMAKYPVYRTQISKNPNQIFPIFSEVDNQ